MPPRAGPGERDLNTHYVISVGIQRAITGFVWELRGAWSSEWEQRHQIGSEIHGGGWGGEINWIIGEMDFCIGVVIRKKAILRRMERWK